MNDLDMVTSWVSTTGINRYRPESLRDRGATCRPPEDALEYGPDSLRKPGASTGAGRRVGQGQERSEDQHRRLLGADAVGEQAVAVGLDEAAANEGLGALAEPGHARHPLRRSRLGELLRAH
jgi:hypothetical protein